MASTITFNLTNADWTDISTTVGTSGFLFNNSDENILFRQDESVPASTLLEGHILKPKNQINYSIVAPEAIYARALDSSSVLTATAGTLS